MFDRMQMHFYAAKHANAMANIASKGPSC
jgi:hypothetical protein